jgi:ABC-type transport system involved in multi-copper enzyme maturation permease subunit
MIILHIAWFELALRLRMLSTYVYFAIFFGIAFLFMSVAGGAIPQAAVDFGAGGKVPANSPFSILLFMMIGAYFGTITTAAIAGRATFQDIDHRTTAFFYTAPIRERDYLGGRYLGSLLTVLVLYPAFALGAFAATKMPFIDATRIGPNHLSAYVSPYLTILVPNLLFTSAIFFALATLLRRMLPVYVGAVVLVLGYMIAGSLTSNLDNRTLGAMLDPFGGGAAGLVTQYWSIAEKSTLLVPLTGVFLWNRLAWGGLGLAIAAFTFYRFSFSDAARAGQKPPAEEAAPAVVSVPVPSLDFSRGAALRALYALTRLQLRETVKNVFFLVIVLAGVLFVVVTGLNADQLFGTRTWLVTYEVLEVVGGTFTIFIVIIIAFYSGELVWRERDAGLAPIFDALPVPRWVYFTSKLFALMAVQVLLVAVLMATGMLLQLGKGYLHLEPWVYVRWLFGVRLVSFWFLCALAMLVHVVVNNKYAGHFAMVFYLVAMIVLPLVGLEHRLYRIGSMPPFTYSAMNGFGPFTESIVVFEAYWSALAVAFAVVANALWVRGVDASGKERLRAAWATRSRATVVALAASGLVFGSVGGFIYWNTNVLHHFTTSHESERRGADAEKKYKRFQALPQPTITAVTVTCDLFPDERRADIRGKYSIENASNEPISQVLVGLPYRAKIVALSFGHGEHGSMDDRKLGYIVYDLATPLAPHETGTVDFDIAYESRGFANSGTETRVVDNGTFLNSGLAPHFGYGGDEIEDDATRHKFDLPPYAMPPAGDPVGSMHNYVAPDAHWVTFDATVSTSPDQIALAPGYLDREWTEGGRRHFHYTMGTKILGFYSFLSARYAVVKDKWTAPPTAMPGTPPEVSIEIDYQPGHEWNLPRMVKGVKLALDYYTEKFGPYQHHQVRIVEFPRYESFAQSFPNTIPYSESVGFIARVKDDDPEDIDYPLYITAHEVAHQWWAHQVIGGMVQGATMLSETLAEYSSLIVMKHEYGDKRMRRFLRYDLDNYLRGRSGAKRAEQPLVKVENQTYIHYAKGSLAMYALADYIGEDAVAGALARFLAKTKYVGPPYPDARDLVAELRAVVPPEYPNLITDLFETITLFDNHAKEASYVKRPDGKYEVTVTVVAKKLRAGELGAETEVPIDDVIDIGVLDKDGTAIALERRRLTSPEATFTLVVDSEPHKAGIDPLNKLIDRQPEDNVVRVVKKD